MASTESIIEIALFVLLAGVGVLASRTIMHPRPQLALLFFVLFLLLGVEPPWAMGGSMLAQYSRYVCFSLSGLWIGIGLGFVLQSQGVLPQKERATETADPHPVLLDPRLHLTPRRGQRRNYLSDNSRFHSNIPTRFGIFTSLIKLAREDAFLLSAV